MRFRQPGSSTYEGHEIDCAELLAADLGLKPAYVAADQKTLVNGLVADQYDIVMTGTSMSAVRAATATFADSWGRNAFVLLLKRDIAKYANWAALGDKGVTVGTNLGTPMEQFVQTSLPKASLHWVESPARGWQELLGVG